MSTASMLPWQQIVCVTLTLNQVTCCTDPTPAHHGSTPLPLESPSVTLSAQCAMAPLLLHTFSPCP